MMSLTKIEMDLMTFFCVYCSKRNISEIGHFTNKNQVVAWSLLKKLHLKGEKHLLSIINCRIFVKRFEFPLEVLLCMMPNKL